MHVTLGGFALAELVVFGLRLRILLSIGKGSQKCKGKAQGVPC